MYCSSNHCFSGTTLNDSMKQLDKFASEFCIAQLNEKCVVQINIDAIESLFETVCNCKITRQGSHWKMSKNFQLVTPLPNRKITIEVAHDMSALGHCDVLTTVNNILKQNMY
jgi:hypothetical protein